MNQPLTTIEPRRSVTMDMAGRYGMEAPAFEATLRATIFPSAGTREEFAAFLLVAREYNLNPITREIYAMPKKGGGIIPVVSIDGWVRLANEHRAFDGMTFEAAHDDKGELISITCSIFRKDRSHPTVVTEYLSECKRNTDPWLMKHRMLRHKAMIQCARYAFGFAGIYDEDEAERFADREYRASANRRAPPPHEPAAIEHKPTTNLPPIEDEPRREVSARRAPPPPPMKEAEQPALVEATASDVLDFEALRKRFIVRVKDSKDREDLALVWNELIEPVEDDLFPPDKTDLENIYRMRQAELD